jgi:hypothetical protein
LLRSAPRLAGSPAGPTGRACGSSARRARQSRAYSPMVRFSPHSPAVALHARSRRRPSGQGPGLAPRPRPGADVGQHLRAKRSGSGTPPAGLSRRQRGAVFGRR